MQAPVSQKSNIIVKSKNIFIGSITKSKNIRKFKPKSSMVNFMCSVGGKRNICMVGTRTIIGTMTMGPLQNQQNIVGFINSIQPDTKANAAPGENPWFTTTQSNPQYQRQQEQHQYHQLDNYEQSKFQPISNYNCRSKSPTWNQQPYRSPQICSTPPTISGVFGEVGYKPTLRVDNMSPSPPPLRWSSCSMFMVATEAWPDGINSKSDTTGEQLNTPRPEDVCGFENGLFGGLVPSDNKPSNVISKNNINNSSSSIIMMNEEVHSNNNNSSMYGSKKEQLFNFKTSSMTPPSFTLDEVPYNSSWQFEPCPEETMLSPDISYLTPHQSPGVASPGSSSGAAEYRGSDEFETCVDFSKLIFIPNTEVVEGSTALSDEIEQLSESYYCKSNNLISVNDYIIDGDSSVSPSFLKVLQEETTTVGDETPSSVAANGIVFETHPSFATIFQPDADNLDDDKDELEKSGKDVADAIAWTQEALQNVSSRDDTLDLKTQTQLEHNYTIKLPLDEGTKCHTLTTNNKVKELLKPREATLLQQPKRVQPSVKRQLFERKHCEMSAAPKLKLNMSTEAATIAAPLGIPNTPDLTNQVLDLEADVFSNEGKFDLLTYIDSFTDYDTVPNSPVEEKPKILAPEEPAPAPQSTICATTLSDLFNPAKRKLPMITIDNIDELTASTNPKKSRYATSSTTSSLYGDNASETSSTPRTVKRRGRPPKQDSSIRDRSEYQHLNEEDQRYREQRDKNNEASRRSRLNRRDREVRLEQEGDALKRQYEELKSEERTLIQDCARWRKAVMRLALL